jgi:hypothetical protein
MNTNAQGGKAHDTGDWQNNKEMNPAANSSATADGLLQNDESQQEWRESGNDRDWRDSEKGRSAAAGGQNFTQSESGSGNPGRTPGKAEGTENFQGEGNE